MNGCRFCKYGFLQHCDGREDGFCNDKSVMKERSGERKYVMAIRRIKKLSDVIEALRLYQLKPLDCKPHCPYAEECENPDECICSSREEDALIYLEEFQKLGYCHPQEVNVEGEDILLCSECYYKIEPCVNYCSNCGRKIDWNWEHNE